MNVGGMEITFRAGARQPGTTSLDSHHPRQGPALPLEQSGGRRERRPLSGALYDCATRAFFDRFVWKLERKPYLCERIRNNGDYGSYEYKTVSADNN